MSNVPQNKSVDFSVEEIQMALGQKDLEIILYQKQIKKLNDELVKLKKTLPNRKD